MAIVGVKTDGKRCKWGQRSVWPQIPPQPAIWNLSPKSKQKATEPSAPPSSPSSAFLLKLQKFLICLGNTKMT